jgi:hypothetical protein
MLERFWAERIEDFDLRNKIGMADTLGTEQVQSLLQQVAELTDGLSGRSLMQLMNGTCIQLVHERGITWLHDT